jgi:hypothetical protein
MRKILEQLMTPESAARVMRELKVILGVGSGLTLGLWIKRVIEKLVHCEVIDKSVVEGGIRPPATPNVPVPVSNGGWLQPQRPRQLTLQEELQLQRQHLNAPRPDRGFREGPGREWYGSTAGEEQKLHYRAKYTTPDGYVLYDIDDEFGTTGHTEGPCPVLRSLTREGNCHEGCKWYRERHSIWESGCKARNWIANGDLSIGLDQYAKYE